MLKIAVTALLCLSISIGPSSAEPNAGYTVAFLGDTGVKEGAEDVFVKLRDERRPDAILHAGDFSYTSDPGDWWRFYDSVFTDHRAKPAFIGTSGNHDLAATAASLGSGFKKAFWMRYAKEFRVRQTAAGADCLGSPGEMEVCKLHDLVIVNLSYGLKFGKKKKRHEPRKYAKFIEAAFDAVPQASWRICHFHVPVAPYALDPRFAKMNTVDWTVMNACQRYGAIVANAHHHSYSRTHLMSSYRNETIAQEIDWNEYGVLRPGHSLQWVSGLGGMDASEVDHRLSRKEFFAARAAHITKTEKAPLDVDISDFGALLCTFTSASANDPINASKNVDPIDGDLRVSKAPYQKAQCEFRDIRNQVHDMFTLYSRPLLPEIEDPELLTKMKSGLAVVMAEDKRWRALSAKYPYNHGLNRKEKIIKKVDHSIRMLKKGI